ncbi:MAG: MFS transporter [Firmicutes bacterium]|nr:MFS transporter [Bacillota bacterium]
MKLNYKRTIFVGFAFFLICAFWQAYDNTIPLILTNKFGLSQTASGAVMALDNVLALFLLPLFGAISDRCHSKLGKRTPFILIGTIAAAVIFVGLSFADGAQLKNISAVSQIDDPAAMQVIYTQESETDLQTPDGTAYRLSALFSEEEFCRIPSQLVVTDGTIAQTDGTLYALADRFTEAERADIDKHDDGKAFTNPHYTDYVVPARQAYAWNQTAENPTALIVFIALLLMVLLSMATFRSPAVALMPDVTIKPLRSKANAVINLMGSAGGILILGLGMVFATGSVKNSMMSFTPYYIVIALVMLTALALFLWQVREPKLVKQMQEESRRYGIEEETQEENGGKLGKGERRSMCFLLASIVLWFMGYNAVTSKYSVYASSVLNKDYNLTLIIAQAAAIISYLPIGMVSSKLGRKKTILTGIVMLTTSFTVACFLRESSPTILMNAMFALAGIGWATINVNSFPMVVEMCKGGSVGKYTGIYYTASMAAQTVTPLLSGYLMDKLGLTALFPYAAVFVALAFVTMLFVMHGDNKPTAKRGLEALDVED